MKEVPGASNEYQVTVGEIVTIVFDTQHWENLTIRVSTNMAPFSDVTGHYYSFTSTAVPLNLRFEFNFAVPGYCDIDGSGDPAGDTFSDRARYIVSRPDQKEYDFHI